MCDWVVSASQAVSAEAAVLECIRNQNDVRSARAREFVGGLYFLVAVGMLVLASITAVLHSYVLPLRRFEAYFDFAGSPRWTTLFWYLVFNIIYFVATVFGGMTGFIVCTGLLVVWFLLLLIIWCIRRGLHKSQTKKALKKAQEEDDKQAADLAAAGAPPVPAKTDAFALQESTAFKSGDYSNEFASMDFSPSRVSFQVNNQSDELQPQPSAAWGKSGKRSQSIEVAEGGLNESGGGGEGQLSQSFKPSASSKYRIAGKSASSGKKKKAQHEWTGAPEPISNGQRGLLLAGTVFFLLVLGIIWIILIAWKVQPYYFIDQNGVPQKEQVQLETAQTLQCMYAFPEFATQFKLDAYVKWFTEYCGTHHRKSLSDADKKTIILEDWIMQYNINMTQFIPSDYRNYTSLNSFITRKIDLRYRPQPESLDRVVSPADARTLVYLVNDDLRIWLKGYTLTYSQLLGNIAIEGTSRYYENGAALISRLAPQDYHRIHSPVSGSVEGIYNFDGPLWSVGPDGSGSGNGVLLNRRQVIIINAGVKLGYVAVVAVGATCIGSIQLETFGGDPLVTGAFVERGDQLGFFQFGGSTLVTLFPQNRVIFDDALVYRSRFPVETSLLVNEDVGYIRP